MRVFNGIIGVLSIFGAIHCILWDGTSFLNYGWTVTFILLLWGICAIATYAINRKETKKNDANLAATGIIGLVFGIIGCVISIIAIGNIRVQAMFVLLIFVLYVIVMFITGIRLLIYASRKKKSEKPDGSGQATFAGIVCIIIGAGGLISWLSLNALSGTTLGIMLGVSGIIMLIGAFTHDDHVSVYDELEI